MESKYIPLTILPFHHFTRGKYYLDYKKWVKKNKVRLEKRKGEIFENLDDETVRYYEEKWSWPAWKFNDIAGYVDLWLEISEEDNLLFGYIFLKRKFFHRKIRERLFGRYSSLLKNHEYFYYRKTSKERVKNKRRNMAYVKACSKVIEEAEKLIRERNTNFQLWLPPFDCGCINFVKIYRQFSKEIS